MELRTGDVILTVAGSEVAPRFATAWRELTHSPYVHAALVCVSPFYPHKIYILDMEKSCSFTELSRYRITHPGKYVVYRNYKHSLHPYALWTACWRVTGKAWRWLDFWRGIFRRQQPGAAVHTDCGVVAECLHASCTKGEPLFPSKNFNVTPEAFTDARLGWLMVGAPW